MSLCSLNNYLLIFYFPLSVLNFSLNLWIRLLYTFPWSFQSFVVALLCRPDMAQENSHLPGWVYLKEWEIARYSWSSGHGSEVTSIPGTWMPLWCISQIKDICRSDDEWILVRICLTEGTLSLWNNPVVIFYFWNAQL